MKSVAIPVGINGPAVLWGAILGTMPDGKSFRVGAKKLTFERIFEEHTLGDLPEECQGFWRKEHPKWAFFSYATPIAWPMAGGWRVPRVSYSLTTSEHRLEVLSALRFGTQVEQTPALTTRAGKGMSPYGPRSGGF